MDVKPVPPPTSYAIGAASETPDKARDQAERRPPGKAPFGRKAGSAPAKFETPPPAPETKESSSPLASSQMVDSEKVLDLLAHRPASPRLARFVKMPSPTRVKSPLIDVKKLDKSL